ncbi:Uncharacterised protein [Candidatus Bartonella washoeensis]|nr:Uncharacterised protein [Bartonella washoeensis]
MSGGEQNLYMGDKKTGGGFCTKYHGFRNGRQHVLEEGTAANTTLKDKATQVVYPGGIVDGLTITDSASSVVICWC